MKAENHNSAADQALAELVEQFNRLRLDDPRRGELARQIRRLEDAIGWEEKL